MALTTGSHHLATVKADMDRLVQFYERVFDANVTLDMREDDVRHVFIDLGGGFVLHPFEVVGVEVAQGELPLFERGRSTTSRCGPRRPRRSGSFESGSTRQGRAMGQ